MELETAQEQLKLFQLAVEQSPTSIMITGADSAIQYVNPYFCTESGYSKTEVLGRNPRLLNAGMTPYSTIKGMWTKLRRGEPWSGELINRRKSGDMFWEEARIAPVKNADDQITHYVAVKLDVTERKQTADRLAFMAHHDELTHLPNRSLFFARLNKCLASAQRNGDRLGLLFIDLGVCRIGSDTVQSSLA